MTREEILKSFLADDLFLKKGYLKEGEADALKWSSIPNNKIFQVIEIAIEGDVSNESPNITEKKINQLLNQHQ
jgi:hypothetical protein